MGSPTFFDILVLRRVALAPAVALLFALGCGAATSTDGVGLEASERADAPPRRPDAASLEGERGAEVPVIEAPPPELTRPPLALARVPEAGGGALDEVGLVIEVGEAAIVVDNEPALARLLGDRSPEARALVAAITDEAGGDPRRALRLAEVVDPTRRRGSIVEELYEEVREIVDQARAHAVRLDRPAILRAEVHLDAALPFTRVIEALYSASLAEVAEFQIMVEGADGRRALALVGQPSGPDAAPCWRLAVSVASDGVTLYMSHHSGILGVGLDPPGSPSRASDGAPLVIAATDGACPALPGPVGEGSAAALDGILSALGELPRCPALVLEAAGSIRWSELAPLASRLAERGPLAFALAGTPLPCEGATRPRGVAAALKRRSASRGADPFAGLEAPSGAGQPISGVGLAK